MHRERGRERLYGVYLALAMTKAMVIAAFSGVKPYPGQ